MNRLALHKLGYHRPKIEDAATWFLWKTIGRVIKQILENETENQGR